MCVLYFWTLITPVCCGLFSKACHNKRSQHRGCCELKLRTLGLVTQRISYKVVAVPREEIVWAPSNRLRPRDDFAQCQARGSNGCSYGPASRELGEGLTLDTPSRSTRINPTAVGESGTYPSMAKSPPRYGNNVNMHLRSPSEAHLPQRRKFRARFRVFGACANLGPGR